ncbi:DMT family transporter [Saccharopolyspora endophytica]|uniref:DMT family transporter n=1 Tax=Saccharopolyspora endophytica TaxID=543886 RepID=UPI0027DDA4BF|nr:DMT family transporter [Saccharopolyspora endophytica]
MLATSVGALGVATSGLFVALSATSPGTASFFRCALALPLLAPLALAERVTGGRITPLQAAWAATAGALFAADALLWTQAIHEVGVGLSVVLVNTQVVMVPLLAVAIDRETLSRRFLVILPVITAGTLLTGGVLETGATGAAPVAGTIHAVLAALCYSGFLFLLRRGGPDRPLVQSYLITMASAAVFAAAVGAMWGGFDAAPGWGPLGWLALTALCGQVLGWLLIAVGSPRLRVEVSSALLLLTPVGALLLGAIALEEAPSALQALGCALVLSSAYLVAASNDRDPRPDGG